MEVVVVVVVMVVVVVVDVTGADDGSATMETALHSTSRDPLPSDIDPYY